MADEDEIPEEEIEFEEEDLVDDLVDPDDLDEEDLEVDEEDEAFVVDGDSVIDDVEDIEEEPAATTRRLAATDEEDDDDDIVDPDDVEADLDTILKDRLVTSEEEPDEDDEEVEVDDRGDPVDRIQPKRPGEFVCQSCFLVKHPGQLADAKKKLCSDCV